MGRNVKSLRIIVCLGLAASTLGLAGCRTTHTETTTQMHADRQLALDVADNLRRAPDSTFPDVAVTANHGRVLLRGYVANDSQKAEAGQIAAAMPGVTGVDNDLTIRPTTPAGAATSP